MLLAVSIAGELFVVMGFLDYINTTVVIAK